MGSRYEVEVTVGSAQDLKNVNWRNGDLKPYAVVWVDDGPKSSTHVDTHDGENPDWDEKLLVPVPPSAARLEDAVLHIDVVHANAAQGVKPLVGYARLPLRDVLDGAKVGSKVNRNLRLKRPSGRPQGRLDVRVAIREASSRGARYPDPAPYGHRSDKGGYAAAPPPAPAPAYAAPPVGYPAPAYAAPSAPAYPVTAAAAPPVVVAPVVDGRRHGGSGMGAGTGLAVGAAAGMLGGLALAGGAHYIGGAFDDDCCDDDYYCDDDC
ncbi:hypothetical protein HU200_056967 [Digitaria exilis]|uniref:C2 domain-containing protein n=1 Tax=Digitaria exilis TaxID=1010633 RepID=A0A835ABV8_9POAL|nr:hypothetical protein HU200_056967 [Digitaria exilis]CAB3476826.1 unnamed protein product [Digitaria exilis]